MPARRRLLVPSVVLLVAGLVAAVALHRTARSDPGRPASALVLADPATTDSRPAGVPTATRSPRVERKATRPPRPSPTPTPVPVASRQAPSRMLVERLNGVGSARQVISVVASGYGTSYATLQAFTRTSGGWQRTFGPWPARIGRAGFAPAGAKREGDGRTPSGSYGFQFMFGTKPNPGVHYEYRRVTGPHHVWADDPGTPRYNLWSDTRHQYAGPTPEPMNQVPAYHHSAVIAYNTARTSGLGSAIFLHVSTGGSTAGCVSLPESQLLSVLRWLDPAKQPRIVMGTASVVS